MALAAAALALVGGTGTAAARLSWSGAVASDAAGTGPALTGVACPTVSECVATDVDGAVVAFDPAAPAPESPTVIDPNGITGLACVSAAQCVVVDFSGQEVTFDPANPGGAVASTIDSGQIVDGVTCTPSAGTCTAIDYGGNEVTFAPGSPGTPTPGAPGPPKPYSVDTNPLIAVSCPAPGANPPTCGVIDAVGSEIQFNPLTGSKTAVSSGGGTSSPTLTAISCAQAGTCVVFDKSGTATVEGGGSTSSATIDYGHSLTDGDCVSATQCTAIDDAGAEITFAPGSSGRRSPIDAQAQMSALSCASTDLCVAVDVAGHAVTFNPASPQTASRALVDRVPSLTAVACPATTQCTGADASGGEVTFDPAAAGGTTSAAVDPGAVIYGIACPATSQCTAVDANGAEVTFDPGAPGGVTPVALVHNHPLLAVACPVATQCTAVDDDQYAVTFNPQAPTTGRYAVLGTPAGVSLTGIACPSSVQCTAVDGTGQQVTFNPQDPGTPTPTTVLPHGAVGVSCPTPRQCTAVGVSGDWGTFDPEAPAAVHEAMLTAGRLGAVACPSTGFCLAADASGHALEFDPHGAGATASAAVGAGAPLTAVACVTAGLCVGVDSANRAFAGSGPVPPAPSARGAPRIVGRARQGATLKEVHGSWSATPTSYVMQWERCDRHGVCRSIAGATGGSYRLGQADVGDTIGVVETASDAGGGSPPQASARTRRVTGQPGPPRFSEVSLTGAHSRRPRLSLTVIANPWGPLLRQLQIVLPEGLRVARSGAVGVDPSRRGVRHVLSHRGRAVTILLPRAVSRLRVTLGSPGLTISAGAARAGRRGARALTLTGTVAWSGHSKLHFVGSFKPKS